MSTHTICFCREIKKYRYFLVKKKRLIRIYVLGFNDKSTLVGHFVSSPREREKRYRIVEELKERDREEREPE